MDQHFLVGCLDSAGVVGLKRILGRQATVCPQGKIIAVCEVGDLGDQLVAQCSRGLGGKQRLWLPRLVDRAIGRYPAVLGALAGVRGDQDHRRGLDDQIRRVEIILAGNPDQREQRIAPGIA